MMDELSNLWENLSLAEDEDGELEIQKTEVTEIINRGKFCIIGKLLSERIISKETIKTTFVRWWRLKKTFTFKILGDNLFLIEFVEAGDKLRVLEGRPWVYEGSLFLVEDFDGRTSPSEYTFDRASFWVRMVNLPLACMGREVGFKLGASVGRVEEVDTEKDGIGWGEFLRVKINVDLYKPLSRGRMLKFDGKSTLVGFKYEHLPKFCFHCGVICHGAEGCLKRSKMRNQEVNQYGLWMRATSPTRRTEKTHDRHADSSNSTRHAKFSEELPKQSGVQGKKEFGRKRRATESGENSAGEDLHGRHNVRAKDRNTNYAGDNRGEELRASHFEFQTEKERSYVGVMKGHFEKFPNPNKETWIPRNEGKINEGVIDGAHARKAVTAGDHAEKSPKRKVQLSPNGPGHVKHAKESPANQQAMSGLFFQSPGGSYSGPIIADVEKSMKGAQKGNGAAKRKNRDDAVEGDLPIILKNNFEAGGNNVERGAGKRGRVEDYGTEIINGSGMAEAGVQPRRPQ
jgi:hypothetical protein